MSSNNKTVITEFILLGLGSSQNLNVLLFSIFLLLYIMTIFVNVLIIALFLASQHFYSAMYFFLCHLSLCDIFLCTNVIPNLLSSLLRDHITIPVNVCMTQHYFSGVFTSAECFLLTLMAYDRYLAICYPLHYVSIMSIKLCVKLVIGCWFLGCLPGLIFTIPLSHLEFCGNNVINHMYCDLAPLLRASCSVTHYMEIEATILSIPVLLCPFSFIIVTYVSIFLAILRIKSTTGRQKAFSTCSSHLTVVSIYYGILIVKYTVPSVGQSLHLNKYISMLYTVVTPFLNPIIYSLRNKEIRSVLSKWISITTTH